MANDYGIPTALPVTEGPGFFGGLLDVLKNIKIAAGPRSVITSGQLPGMSYNDLFAPMRQRQEQEDLTDMYIDLGENMMGLDMARVKQVRAQQKARGTPPSLGFSKAIQGIVQHGMQYGQRRPLGPQVAEAMFPGQQTVITQPQKDWTPEGEYVPPTVEQTGKPLTPIQQVWKELVARSTPHEFAQALPNILKVSPELLGSEGWQSPDKTQFIAQFKAAYPAASPDIWGMLESYHPSQFVGEAKGKTIAELRRWLHEDRGERRLQAQTEREPLRAAQTSFNSTLNVYAPRMKPEDVLKWKAAVGRATTPEQVYALEQQMGQTIPAQEPMTPEQEWRHASELTRGITDNLNKVMAVSGYVTGRKSYEETAPLITMPGGGTLTIPQGIFPSAKPAAKPPPDAAHVRRFLEGAVTTISYQIAQLDALARANPGKGQEYQALAAQYRETLNGIQQDYAAQTSGGAAGAPPTLGGPAAQAATSSNNPMTLAVTEVLEARGLKGVPDDPAQRKEVLDAIYHTMVLRNYNPQGQWVKNMQTRFKGWTPPAAP